MTNQDLAKLAGLLRDAAAIIERLDLNPTIFVEPTRRLLDRTAAAEYLGVSARTISNLADRGEITRVMLGSRAKYDVVDLDAYVERIKPPPTRQPVSTGPSKTRNRGVTTGTPKRIPGQTDRSARHWGAD